INKLCVAALLLGALAQARAYPVKFSYQFVDGETLSATFNGDISGANYINIDAIQAWFDGVAVAGGAPLFAASSLPDYSLVAGGARLSATFGLNNFYFSDRLDPNSAAITESFGIFAAPDGSSTTIAYGNMLTGATTIDTFLNDGSGLSYSSGPNGYWSSATGLAPLLSVNAVAEPPALALLALGLTCMLFGTRRGP
ncbi:MAG TPA: hypothetical protein DCW29_22075, partial [Janthinobacterium sp.]|nr:hypothetical protein [Janthinobacterium sp.]